MNKISIFQNKFKDIKHNELLKNHCSYHIGGPAEFFYELKNIDELPELIKTAEAEKMPYFIFGQGSNILFPDKGLKGLVIKNLANKIIIKGSEIIAESGILLSKLILKAQKHHLIGLENLAGIPGTIGGAVFGNAGAYNTAIGEFIEKIEVYDSQKDLIKTLKKSDLSFGYRQSNFKKQPLLIILRVYLSLKKGQAKINTKEILKTRLKKYPQGFFCGSFFKNPSPDKSAGFLIEECGLKGLKIGEAQISNEHGNFIVNLGNAKTKDVLKLAEMAKEKVKEKFGVELKEEVRIIE